MDFREEYKKAAEIMDPSAEAMERMRKNILAQAEKPVRKPLPITRIATVCGSVAACALIAVVSVSYMNGKSNTADMMMMASSAACAESCMENSVTTAATATDQKNAEYAVLDSVFSADIAEDICEDAEEINADTAAGDSFAPTADSAPPVNITAGNAAPSEFDSANESGAVLEETDGCTEMPDSEGAVKEPDTETECILSYETLEFSEDGSSVLFRGVRYLRSDDEQKRLPEDDNDAAETVEDIATGELFEAELSDGILYIMTSDGELVGIYIEE